MYLKKTSDGGFAIEMKAQEGYQHTIEVTSTLKLKGLEQNFPRSSQAKSLTGQFYVNNKH